MWIQGGLLLNLTDEGSVNALDLYVFLEPNNQEQEPQDRDQRHPCRDLAADVGEVRLQQEANPPIDRVH